jgi:membrane protease YdiL (CAAX protease family)
MKSLNPERISKKWGIWEVASIIWIGIALAVLAPITIFLQGSFPFFTILWLVVPLVIVIRSADATQIGFRSTPWREFIIMGAINLGLLILIAVVFEPWSHAYQSLVNKALSSTSPDTTFAWLTRFTGFKAWAGLIVFSGLVTIFGEELFFRGWLLQVFQRKMSRNLAILVQATLFTLPQLLAALLLAPVQGVIYTVIYSWVAIGLVGGWAAARTRSIWPSLASATVWNAIMVALGLWLGRA